MSDLILTRIQPNPPGRDASRYGAISASQLNNEWVEFAVRANRTMTGDELCHRTFTSNGCVPTGLEQLLKFSAGNLAAGTLVQVHTGSGQNHWAGGTYHMFLGRGWFVWNNSCGDRAELKYDSTILDWAEYNPAPREGVLIRVNGTNKFV